MNVNISNGEMLAGVNSFHTAQTLFQPIRQHALQRVKSQFGDVQRRFIKPQHLRQAIAVIGMFVSDENTVEVINVFFDGRETSERFAFAETTVHQQAGSPGFEQRDVARTAGRQDGNAEAYRSFSKIAIRRCDFLRREFLR
jgi:hypothetical protein